MAKGLHQINHYLESLFSNQSLAELREKISPSSGESYPCIPAPENNFREDNSNVE